MTRTQCNTEEFVLNTVNIHTANLIATQPTSCGGGGGEMRVWTIVVSGPLCASDGFCTGEGWRAP